MTTSSLSPNSPLHDLNALDEAACAQLAIPHAHPIHHIAPCPTQWVWPDHIPLGHLTLLDGDPGSGKSLLALTIAAAVSSGHSLAGSDPLTPGDVLLISPYNSLEALTVPRLLAAGADLARCSHLDSLPTIHPLTGTDYDRPLSVPADLPFICEEIYRLQPRLVILDSLTDLLDPRATSLVLADLTLMASTTPCAILLLRTVRTQPADLVHPRVTGPSTFKLAPAALLSVPHPQQPEQHLLFSSRHTLSPTSPLLAYTITATDQQVPTIDWTDAPPPHLLSLLAGIGPRYSAQRYAILSCLQASLTSLNAKAIASHIGFDDEPVRKMLQRMHLVGDLVSPDRGQYTIPNHPSLATHQPAPVLPDTLSEPAHSDVAPTDATPNQLGQQHANTPNIHVPNVPSKTLSHTPNPDVLISHSTQTPNPSSQTPLAPIATSR